MKRNLPITLGGFLVIFFLGMIVTAQGLKTDSQKINLILANHFSSGLS